jgi:hypothetical protein
MTNSYFNWKEVIDHLAGVVLVMLVRLNVAIGIFGTGQQCILTRLLRRNPINFPTSPRALLSRIYEFCLGPRLATVSAYRYSVTSVSPAQAAPNTVYAWFGGSVS